ncbi:MAG: hypothetical protein KDD44_12240, partial [Bdellovibrionales bacterium]|nr:hypothetical protein [Bdellovibrionales bacterium]
IRLMIAGLVAAIVVQLNPVSAVAEPLIVGFGMNDERRLNLPPDETGVIEVYLASAGDMVDNYPVSLIDESRMAVVTTKKSNEHGILTFQNVPPGRYVLLLRWRSRKERLLRSVKIGDALLSIYTPDVITSSPKRGAKKKKDDSDSSPHSSDDQEESK